MRIALLPSHVANQIAAGEVVERPASVVKELLENSLDAGATRIVIDIQKGGMQLISVSDDGDGIHSQDLPLALARHATSKIKTEEDLLHIASLGFRGEALASIASIARVTMRSKQKNETNAWQIQCQPGEEGVLAPVAHARGTQVEVRDLFFNVPARRKFLKTESTEFKHIQDVVERIALSHFDKAFYLRHHDREILALPLADTLEKQHERIAKIVSQTFVDNAVQLNAQASDIALRGWVGLPTIARNQSDRQYFYVNDRWVKDKLIASAIKRAFQDAMYHDRYPSYVLYLQLDPESVDVNAHPAKHEVRFRDSRSVYDFVLSQVRRAVQAARPEPQHHHVTELPSSFVEVDVLKRDSVPLFFDKPSSVQVQENRVQYEALLHEPAKAKQVTMALLEPGEALPYRSVPVAESKQTVPPLGYAIAQLKQIFILAENEQGLVMVDAHAAHERVLYERLKVAWESQKLASQTLLLPISITVSEKEMECVLANQEFLASMALKVEPVSPTVLAVRAMPAQLMDTSIVSLVRDMIADLMVEEASQQIQDRTRRFLGNLACRAAVHAQQKLSLAQMNALLRDMEKTDLNGQCNHGRPTYRQFSLAELDKFFLRGR